MVIFIFKNSCVVRVDTQHCHGNLNGLVECQKTDGINVSNDSSTSVFEHEEVDVKVMFPPPRPFTVPLHVLLSIQVCQCNLDENCILVLSGTLVNR